MRSMMRKLAVVTGLVSVVLFLLLTVTAASDESPGLLGMQPIPTEVVFQQGTDSYAGSEDTYIESANPDQNACLGQLLLVRGRDSTSSALRFDVSSVPSNATVVEAYLEMYADPANPQGELDLEVGAYGLLKEWSDCEATWTAASDTADWEEDGALGSSDRASTAVDKGIVTGPGWYYHKVTGLVQNWVLDASSNNGLLVASADQRYAELYQFCSAEYPTVGLRPRLRVRYVVTGVAPPLVPPMPDLPRSSLSLQQGVDGYVGCTDTYIELSDPDANHGQDQLLLVKGRVNTSGLVRFDVSQLPSDVVVFEAYLQLLASGDSSRQPLEVASYQVLNPWSAGEATWNNATTGTLWEEAGSTGATDRPATPSDREMLNGAGWCQWNVTDMVQAWGNAPSSNYGLLLESPDERWAETYRFVATGHVAGATYPQLVISYADRQLIPTPTPTETLVPTPTSTPIVPTEVVFQQGTGGYVGSEDTYIELANPDQNACLGQLLLVRGRDTTSTLVRFDVSSVPGNATVVEAYVEMYADPANPQGELELEVGAFGLLKDWVACEATWTAASGALDWEEVGASASEDRTVLPADSGIVAGAGWYQHKVTGLVQNWVLDASSNNGLLVASTDQRYAELYQFCSAEYPTVALRPRLRVRYLVTGVAPAPVAPVPDVPQVMMSFQEGADGYVGCVDTYIESTDPDANHGQDQVLLVRGRVNTSGLVRFDISQLPANAVVLQAYVQLNASAESDAQPLEVASYPVLRSWVAGEATWNNATAGALWGQAGSTGTTDRPAAPSDREMLNGAGWCQWNVTDMVEAWADNPSSNYGLLLESPDQRWSAAYRFIATGHVADFSYPRLVVTYAEGVGPSVSYSIYLPIVIRAM